MTTDIHTDLVPGTSEGVVLMQDDAGTLHVQWDDGSTLGLISDAGDVWELL